MTRVKSLVSLDLDFIYLKIITKISTFLRRPKIEPNTKKIFLYMEIKNFF